MAVVKKMAHLYKGNFRDHIDYVRTDAAQSGVCALLFMIGVTITNTLPSNWAVKIVSFILGLFFLWALLLFEAGSTKKEKKITVYTVMGGLALLPVPIYKLAVFAGSVQWYFLALLTVVLIVLALIEHIDDR
jgi:hypothetical protein